jgi:PadR family transcriptional regulator, regulatory protein PadR
VIYLKEQILRKLFLGFIQIHILYHAQENPFYGVFMIEELKSHGYDISAGTLYPILNNMAAGGLLAKTNRLVGGKIRKYYSITDAGTEVLLEATAKAKELVREIREV